MASEIERKFLVRTPPAADVLTGGVRLRQGYLASEADVEVRLRFIEADGSTACVVTIKAGKGLTRTEVEVPVPADEAEALWPHTAGRRIEKVRHRIDLGGPGGPVAEFDVYDGALQGLCTVEVEFASEHDAAVFSPPAWFGADVTDQPGWSNRDLARHGRPV